MTPAELQALIAIILSVSAVLANVAAFIKLFQKADKSKIEPAVAANTTAANMATQHTMSLTDRVNELQKQIEAMNGGPSKGPG